MSNTRLFNVPVTVHSLIQVEAKDTLDARILADNVLESVLLEYEDSPYADVLLQGLVTAHVSGMIKKATD